MTVYKVFPIKDTSLYSMFPTMNSGIDPISQVSNLNLALSTNPTVARNLIQFDTNDISDVLENKTTGSFDVYLRSFIATAQGINEDSDLHVYPLAQSTFSIIHHPPTILSSIILYQRPAKTLEP